MVPGSKSFAVCGATNHKGRSPGLTEIEEKFWNLEIRPQIDGDPGEGVVGRMEVRGRTWGGAGPYGIRT